MATFAPVMTLPQPHRLLCAVVLLVLSRGTHAAAQAPDHRQPQQLAEDRRVAEHMLPCQRDTGGWPRNTGMKRPLSPDERTQILRDKQRRDDSTTDNGATTGQMTFQARVYRQTNHVRYRQAFLRGMAYLLSGQYANGGWPQCWPEKKGYRGQITFNDDAMVNTLRLLRHVNGQRPPFQGNLTDRKLSFRSARLSTGA